MRTKFFVIATFIMALAAAPAFAADRSPDSRVIAEIQNKLFDAGVPRHGDVRVDFSDGVATLTGTVDSVGMKQAAERAAEKVDEVAQVADQMTVGAAIATDQQIVETARKEIVTYPFYTIFDHIQLRAESGVLSVEGQVSEPSKKAAIGNFLAYVKGVSEVRNNLEVLPTSLFDDQLRVAVARSIYNDPFFIQYATTALPSIHIIVKNGNVTLEGVVNSSMDKVKAQHNAAFAGTYFSLTNNLRVEG